MANKIWVGGSSGNETIWSTGANWSPSGAPSASDNVRVPASAAWAIAGADVSGTALAAFQVDEGCVVGIGSAATYLKLSCTSFSYNGSGQSYIDMGSSAIPATINGTASAVVGSFGLYLKGSAITTVSVSAGDVGIAMLGGDTATVTAVRSVGDQASVTVGSGVTLATASALTGDISLYCAATTVDVYSGAVDTEGTGAVGTAYVYGGTFTSNSSGTVGQVYCNGGLADFTQNGVSRTATHVQLNPGGQLAYDPAVLTITNWDAPAYPTKLTAVAAT